MLLLLYAPLVIIATTLAAATTASAATTPPPAHRFAAGLEARQEWTTGWWGQEFLTYGCQAPIIFVFAKATLEPGNLGNTVGPLLSNGLKTVFGVQNVETQGVNYWGLPDTNFCPGGAPILQRILIAASACPNSKIVAAGYSQGAALVHRAIEQLGPAVKDKIAGVVTFGDTQAWQDSGRIRGYPPERTLIICNQGDVLCTGAIIVVPIHFDYTKWVPTAVRFLAARLLEANLLDSWPGGVELPLLPPEPPPIDE